MNGSQYLAHSSNVICHYGVAAGNGAPGRGSGRYPKGSGKRPNQHDGGGGVSTGQDREGIPIGLAIYITLIGMQAAIIGGMNAHYKNKEKRELKKKHKGQERDKKTGFWLKDREYTEQEDIDAVNPTATQNVEKLTRASLNNCMLCSMTYELRKRGYDVEARVNDQLGFDKNIAKWYPGSKIENTPFESGTSFCRQLGIADPGSKKEITQYRSKAVKMLQSQPNGSRGALLVNWEKNGQIGSGHAVNYEIDKGKLKIIDCQVGKVYTGKSVTEEFINRTCGLKMVRLDNVDFDPKTIKEVAK